MAEAARRARFVTWNLHGCVGRDGRHDVERVGACVRWLAPDVAAFQEVDSRGALPGRSGVADLLRQAVGDHGHEAWSISGADGRYGQILASRYPLEDRHVHDISIPGREPRMVIEVRIRLPGLTLRAIATHLGLRRRERRRQVALLRDIVMTDRSAPTVLLGDFNEWRRWGPETHGLFKLFDTRSTQPSFPSGFPVFALDRVLCRPSSIGAEFWTARDARMASDHLPVVAELSLPGGG